MVVEKETSKQTKASAAPDKKQTRESSAASTRQPECFSASSHLEQRYLGNSYLQSVVEGPQAERQESSPSVANQAQRPMRIQAKLKISQPGDKYEQEADRIADLVVQMPEPMVPQQTEGDEYLPQTKPLCDQITAIVQSGQTASQPSMVTPELESRIRALRGRGRPLPESARAFFEPLFGYDFGQVRVHTDASSAGLTSALNAQALAVGKEIVFGVGQYTCDSKERRGLLAHELTHVIQQGPNPQSSHLNLLQKQPPGGSFISKEEFERYKREQEDYNKAQEDYDKAKWHIFLFYDYTGKLIDGAAKAQQRGVDNFKDVADVSDPPKLTTEEVLLAFTSFSNLVKGVAILKRGMTTGRFASNLGKLGSQLGERIGSYGMERIKQAGYIASELTAGEKAASGLKIAMEAMETGAKASKVGAAIERERAQTEEAYTATLAISARIKTLRQWAAEKKKLAIEQKKAFASLEAKRADPNYRGKLLSSFKDELGDQPEVPNEDQIEMAAIQVELMMYKMRFGGGSGPVYGCDTYYGIGCVPGTREEIRGGGWSEKVESRIVEIMQWGELGMDKEQIQLEIVDLLAIPKESHMIVGGP